MTKAATTAWLTAHNAQDRYYMTATQDALAAGELPSDPRDAAEAVLEGSIGRAIRPMQLLDELAGLIEVVAETRPKRLVEIGTARGGTLMLLCRFAAPDATIVSVDLPYGRNGGGYPKWKMPFYQDFALPGQTLHLLRGNSHDPDTRDRVRDALGGPADLIFIDADHSYAGVKTDYELYTPLLRPGGIAGLHDILPNEDDPSIDVAPFWDKLEADARLKTRRIVQDPDQGAYGIGLVEVPTQA
ncbi:class I SAM-dependent methyltransferase [Litorisediminicola beolgyonensis]|uniref:Class I SAM-dependent methyltransferase n=1 Tax=Litorisediminicola beolgyonensis TaxID=1173614 RepID=A0ABW3ZEI4_9RHOB